MKSCHNIETLSNNKWPSGFSEINDPPKKLYFRGEIPKANDLYLTIVGSRKYTNYGREVVNRIIGGLRGSPLIIVSGLALGIDSLVHKMALSVGLKCLAIPGSGLSDTVLYPRSNLSLAHEILSSGGTLLSEYDPFSRPSKYMFPKRNRLMAGIGKAVLIVEAREKSGSLITARLALDYNREVLSVPGPITSRSSIGTNSLIADGATPISTSEEILRLYELEEKNINKILNQNLSDIEQELSEILLEPKSRDEIINSSKFSSQEVNKTLTLLEMKGVITDQKGNIYLN